LTGGPLELAPEPIDGPENFSGGLKAAAVVVVDEVVEALEGGSGGAGRGKT
jgi:hypothetical protein